MKSNSNNVFVGFGEVVKYVCRALVLSAMLALALLVLIRIDEAVRAPEQRPVRVVVQAATLPVPTFHAAEPTRRGEFVPVRERVGDLPILREDPEVFPEKQTSIASAE